MEKVNIVIGRFQPFTLGHLKCCENTYKETGLKTVLLVVNTPASKVNEKHPFETSLMSRAFNDLVKQEKSISGWILVSNADIVKNSEILHNEGFEIAAWTCGTDRYDVYKSMAEKYRTEAQLSDDFKVIEIKRNDDDISATQVRNAIRNDDVKLFKSLVPSSIQMMWKKLKDALEKVDNK